MNQFRNFSMVLLLLLAPLVSQAEELCPGLSHVWPDSGVNPIPESDITSEAVINAIAKLEMGIDQMRNDEYFVYAHLVQGYGLKKMAEVAVPGNPVRARYCDWLQNEWNWPE